VAHKTHQKLENNLNLDIKSCSTKDIHIYVHDSFILHPCNILSKGTLHSQYVMLHILSRAISQPVKPEP
jgi:hypothetical protein